MEKHTSLRMPRGRPREFDVDAAVEGAMGVFWSFGYHGASIPDLLETTHLSRGTLYAAFGDKRGLFLRALDRYIDQAIARLDAELDPPESALAGLRTCIAGYVECTGGTAGKRGCLEVATAIELAAHDNEVERCVRRFFKAMEKRLIEALERAQASQELADGVEPVPTARLLLCLIEGMRVLGKTGPDLAMQQTMMETFIRRIAR